MSDQRTDMPDRRVRLTPVQRELGGNSKDESDLHRRLEHLRIRGEWFANTPELRKVISRRRGRGANKKIDEATGALPS